MTFWPPGRLSTTTCWLQAFASPSAISRALMSGEEPGGCDRIQCTGRAGKSCAIACPNAAHRVETTTIRTNVLIASPPLADLEDLLREPVQPLGDAVVADQEIVAAPAVGALRDVGRVAHHVHVLLDLHGLVVAHQRALD